MLSNYELERKTHIAFPLRTYYNTLNSTIISEVKDMNIAANDLKVKGVSYLEGLLKKYREVFITVRGKSRMVVLPIEEYERLREADLEMAVRDAEEDYKAGRYVAESAEKHFKRMKI